MAEHLHYRGDFVITTERDGATLLYSVAPRKGGCVIAAGFDMLNCDEGEAIQRMLEAAEAHGRRYRNPVWGKHQ